LLSVNLITTFSLNFLLHLIKHNPKVKNPKKKFLKLPEFPGGKEAFKKYIRSNLIYPKKALEQRIQGVVHLRAEINDNGDVLDAIIEKGLAGGCNEEAIRLIKNVQFGSVKNRGLRVKTRKKFRIEFKLPPEKKISYKLTKETVKENEQKPKKSYSYTIPLGPQ